MDMEEVLAKLLIDRIIEYRRPLGLFLIETKNYPGYLVAIDNQTGDCWTEEFDCKQTAMDWLQGRIEVNT